MPADTSEYRIEIVCDALDTPLRLERGTVQERLGTLFEINLSLYSEDKEIDMAALLGEPMVVRVSTASEERFFHGIVCHFSAVGYSDRHGHYQAILRPKLWLLDQGARCRVYENLSVTDIVKECLQKSSVDLGAAASSPVKFEHCVQYRETDLHFVSRMMERHGLYYFFDHTESQHSIVVAASMADHSDAGTFAHAADGGPSDEFQIEDWRATTTLRSSNYRVAGTKHLTRSSIDAKHKTRFSIAGAADLAVDDFEATNELPEPHLDELARVRMQAIDASVEEFTGKTRSTKLSSGSLFTLSGHPRDDQNRQYLIIGAVYQLDGDLPDGSAPSSDPFLVSFVAIDAKTPFSPPIVHKKPSVLGPHLATVVDETDEFGRVTVAFHWGNPDEDILSCRARVSQNWAGKEWGGVFLPHTDHEVIVEFLDGDPDQPIVTGRVYNEESMPPLALPGEKQKSIIRDHGGNELMMDGGDPQVRIFSPAENSEILLGGGKTSQKHTGDGNLVVHFKGHKVEKIDKDKTVEVKGNLTRDTQGIHDEYVKLNYTLKVDGIYKLDVKKDWHENIFGCQSKHIHGWKNEGIIGAETKTIHGSKTEHVTGFKLTTGLSYDLTKFLKKKEKLKDMMQFDCGTDFQVEAGKAISFKTQDFTQNLKNLLIDCTEKADITFKDATIDGDSHTHKPDNEFVVSTKHVQVTGTDKVEIMSKVLDLLGVLEVKK